MKKVFFDELSSHFLSVLFVFVVVVVVVVVFVFVFGVVWR